ncbi:hypothetical protein [Haladaptatus paucihalophilus]|nr:hypothetical protein [Haladaptatus paucihalophilus]SHL02918.1 hypothetical protein SAMN05444342_2789 [Haladaptatus paucihalophilus DX253]
MTNEKQDVVSEYDRGYDEGYERASRRTRRSKRRGTLSIVIGAIGALLLAILVVLALFLGGIWLGSLVADQPANAPITPVVPAGTGVTGDVTVVEGDTTVTVAGTGVANVPIPGSGHIAIIVEPTTITVPTNGDVSLISIRTGGVSVRW